MLDGIKRIFREALQDNTTGKYSHAKIIAMLVAIGATVFMWQLIVIGGMNLEYFIAYLAYGTGHQTLNKFLDNRKLANGNGASNGTENGQKALK